VRERIELVEKEHPKLSMRKQCDLLGVARSSVDYRPVAEDPEDIRIKRLLDGIFLIDPCLGSRRLVTVFERDHGIKINRKRLQRLRREIGHEAIWCRPRTSVPDPGHRKYPYLLRGLSIDEPDQVWCADITYVPMPNGHAYLCAVMDWYSRKVLGWAVSNTMDTALCLLALERAIANAGVVPKIFNTDQGCQFTSDEWIARLTELGVKISMDGRGRWMDNVFIERLWRSVKYEEIYLFEHPTIAHVRAGLARWFVRYNDWRPHESLDNLTPAEVYRPRSASPLNGSQTPTRQAA
jgi:putative transposase